MSDAGDGASHQKSNGYDPQLVQSLVAEIERIDGNQESAKGSYMNQCRQFAAGRKGVYSRAKDQGVSVRSLKAIINDRKLERKQQKIREEMEADDLADFELFQSAMGDTPLGAWAVQQSQHASTTTPLGAANNLS